MISEKTIQEYLVGKILHILPFGGNEPDHVASSTCWCQPLESKDREDESRLMYIHHARDCREQYERKHGKVRSREEFWIRVLSET